MSQHLGEPGARWSSIVRALALALAVLVASALPAAAQQSTRQQQEQVRRQKAQAATEVDALKADASQVQQALADLQADVSGQEALLSDATLAANVAANAAAQATAAADAARARVGELKGQLRQVAVDAYVTGGTGDDPSKVTDPDPGRSLAKKALLEFRANQGTTVLDQLRSAEEDAADAQAAAERQSAEADRKRSEAAARTQQVKAARDQQASYAVKVEDRLNRRLAEAAVLESQDKALSAKIAAEEAAVAARAARAPQGPSSAPFSSGNVRLRTVQGITVAEEIADNLDRLLNAARADGISFGGTGYRDPAQQQALRERNCANPSSDPPSACRPPTARPGSSMHERGLAVDFTSGGRLLQSRGDPGWQWLSSNAATYGFYNLPSEPWHWSTTGD